MLPLSVVVTPTITRHRQVVEHPIDISGSTTTSTLPVAIHGHTGMEEIIMSSLLPFRVQVVTLPLLPSISSFIPQ